MANSALTRLMDKVLASTPGAMGGIIRMEIFDTLKEFAQRTNAWRENIEVQSVQGITDYPISTGYIGYINRLLYVEAPEADDNSPTGYNMGRGSLVPAFLSETGRQDAGLTLQYTPGTDRLLVAVVALTVADPTDKDGLPFFPENLLEKYSDGLTSGVISRLMMQPAKPWSNAKLAMYHGLKFTNAVKLAKNEAEHGFTHRGQRWAFPQAFRAKSQKVRGFR